MLEIKKAKSISGKIDLPPNPDLFLLSLVIAMATNKKTTITPVNNTPLIAQYIDLFSSQTDIKIEGVICHIEPKTEAASAYLPLDYTILPYRNLIVFLLLGLGKTVSFRNLPSKRLKQWQHIASLFGCIIETKDFDDACGIFLSKESAFVTSAESIDINHIHHCFGLALGLKNKLTITLENQFQTPLRFILPAFGYDLSIKSNIDTKSKDPLARRIQLMTAKSRKKSESKLSFTITADLSESKMDEYNIDLPGDDLLGALLIAAKCIVQNGLLVIGNVPVETWAGATLNYIRKMSCSPGIQENKKTSFGGVGLITIQKFKLVGRKIDCKPLYHFDRQLPAMVILSNYAHGQSVYRNLDDYRMEKPDTIEQLLSCVRLLGGRHGEMPDGMVIDGAKQYDGFDLKDDLNAMLNGACAIAGLKCNGTSSVNDSAIKKRWPEFEKIFENICTYRT